MDNNRNDYDYNSNYNDYGQNNYSNYDNSYNGNYNEGYDRGYNGYRSDSVYAQTESESAIMTKTFLVVLAALIVTAITATLVVVSSGIMKVLDSFEIWLFAELAVVICATIAIEKRKVVLSSVLFGVYSIINGLTLSVIFYAYDLGSIQEIFLLTAAMFAGMAVIGATTKIDLTKMGAILIMALWGVLLVTFANILFLHNSGVDLMMDYVGVAIFVGLTAYDTQRLKAMARSGEYLDSNIIAIYCGMQLYLDFINLFLKLLRLFGKSRK